MSVFVMASESGSSRTIVHALVSTVTSNTNLNLHRAIDQHTNSCKLSDFRQTNNEFLVRLS